MTRQYKCTLVTDVIISESARTEGHQQTLDYIPGSCFLGIVAKHYKEFAGKKIDIFHSGKVKFSDAHRIICSSISAKIPAAMCYPKGKKPHEECFISYLITNDDEKNALKNIQLKQCREGFYAMSDGKFVTSDLEKTFAIKSAYDNNHRRSEDKKMYGYQSLDSGTEFIFEIDYSDLDQETIQKIDECLIGNQHIGRSKTAQYGCVKIDELTGKDKYAPIETFKNTITIADREYIALYAFSRLIFVDNETGMSKYQPDEQDDLHLSSEAKIDWTKSQIRTFQYAPWNYTRQTRESERTGIEKGSVIVVDVTNCKNKIPFETSFVGSYLAEGFGKIICNPIFLQSKDKFNAEYKPSKDIIVKRLNNTVPVVKDTALFEYLEEKSSLKSDIDIVYLRVEEFKSKFGSKFKEKFASQWGAIRGIAFATKEEENISSNILTFIGHGLKSEDWTSGAKPNRYDVLENFMIDSQSNIRQAVIHLASEMAKLCKKED